MWKWNQGSPVAERINELLDQWIEELKPTTNVRFHTF